MRLVYCIHSLHNCGGTENVLARKANYLAAMKGWEIFIVTAHQRGRANAFELDPGIKVMDLGKNDSSPFWRSRYLPALDRCLNEIRPDISIAVNGKAIYAFQYCTDGSRKVAEFHFSREKYIMKYGKHPIGLRYAGYRTGHLGRAAAKMDAFVVLTRKDCESWADDVPNAVQIYNPAMEIGQVQASLDNKVMAAAGRLSFQKNYPEMLYAWAKVVEKHPDWTLKIYGDGPERKNLQKMVAAMFPDGNVKLMGRTSDMKPAYMDCSGLVLSSRFEGFPMVLLEASSYGVPMVSYDCPKGPSEIIEDGVNGYLVKNGCTEELADRICRLIEDNQRRKEMGKNAWQMAGRFGIDAIMDKWVELFNRLKFKA